MSESNPRLGAFSNIPIPDPSAITTVAIAEVKRELRQEIAKEVQQLSENSIERRETLRQLIDQRIATVESLAAQNRIDFTQAIKDAVNTVTELFDAKLNALTTSFREYQISTESKVTAAFLAQEKLGVAQNLSNATAAEKLAVSIAKELDALKDAAKQDQASVELQVRNLAERMNRDQGILVGAHQNMTSRKEGIANMASVVAGGVAVLALLTSLWINFGHQTPTTVPLPVTISPTH